MRKLRFLVLVVIVLSMAAGTLPTGSAQEEVNLELWTFVNTHARWFREQAERYQAEVNPNFHLEVIEVDYTALHERLLISLQAGGEGAPDMADIEQGRFGSFLRGGGDPGFLPLNDFLEAGGYYDQLVAAREALYTWNGVTYGVEHALTPVVLYYRADLWEAAGYDPQTFETWDDFIAAAEAIKAANPDAIPLPYDRDHFEVLLRQRGADYFNAEGEVVIDSELSIDTMNWLIDLTNRGISELASDEDAARYAAFNEGRYWSWIGADWYAGFFKDNAPDLAGKWQAAPLPAWEPGGRRTSCWGGTGLTIMKTSSNTEAALDFVKFAMLSVEGNVRRFELTNLFPPFIPAMDNERLHSSDEYFSGQDLGALFADVAPEVPPQYQSPFRSELQDLYRAALIDIVEGNRSAEDAFKEIANTIRDEMEFES